MDNTSGNAGTQPPAPTATSVPTAAPAQASVPTPTPKPTPTATSPAALATGAASASAVASGSSAQPTAALREDLLKSAVSFLSSPNVASAETAKKVAFLSKKGLTQAEIEEAFKRVGQTASQSSSLSSSLSPSPVSTSIAPPGPLVPARPPQTYQALPPQIIYKPQPQVPTQRVVAMALTVAMGAVGVTAGLVSLIKYLVLPKLLAIMNYQRTRYSQRQEAVKKLKETLDKEEPEEEPEIMDHPAEKPEPLAVQLAQRQSDLASQLERIVSQTRALNKQSSSDSTLSSFRTTLAAFKNTVNTPDNSYAFGPSLGLGVHFDNETSPVQGLKSEIRSLKGLLLNRRNFPLVNGK